MPGRPKKLTQLVDLRRNETEVFCNERQVAENFLDAPEERMSRCLYPLPVHGSFFISSYGPVGFEAAEVIKADDVVERQVTAHAGDPPIKSAFLKNRPHL